MEMNKFPSIEQFRNVVKEVTQRSRYVGKDDEGKPIYNNSVALPSVTFTGRIKIHGTNAGIGIDNEGNYWCQSRERILSLTQDNAGFFVYANKNKDFFSKILTDIMNLYEASGVIVYGEWAGKGVQKGVAVSELEKSFYVFGVKLVFNDEDEWANDLIKLFDDAAIGLYNLDTFKTYSITIDFNEPESAINQMVEWVEEVEKECPVGKYFGVSGVGEGIVFSNDEFGLKFKVKGEKHQSSHVKTLAPVDVEEINKVKDFVTYSVTQSRLEQGISVMRENNIETTPQNTGVFVKWIVGDVMKEESDVIIENGLDAKKIAGAIGKAASDYYKREFF